jgi:hypothetical protein
MIFNSVTSFIESVGRTRVSTRAELDQLVVKWTGPTTLVDKFAPGPNAVHPVLTGMQVRSVRKVVDVAGITGLEVEYHGRFDATHTPSFGDVIIEVSSSQAELDYQQAFSYLIGPGPGNSPSSPSVLYKVGINTYVLRYNGLNTTYRYVLNPKPAIKPTGPLFGSGIGPEFLPGAFTRFGGQNSVTTTTDPNTVLANLQAAAGNVFGFSSDLYCSNYEAVPTTQDWYQVTETWSSRYITP